MNLPCSCDTAEDYMDGLCPEHQATDTGAWKVYPMWAQAVRSVRVWALWPKRIVEAASKEEQ